MDGCVGSAAAATGSLAPLRSRPEVEGGQAIQVISHQRRIGGEQHEGASQRATLACQSPQGEQGHHLHREAISKALGHHVVVQGPWPQVGT